MRRRRVLAVAIPSPSVAWWAWEWPLQRGPLSLDDSFEDGQRETDSPSTAEDDHGGCGPATPSTAYETHTIEQRSSAPGNRIVEGGIAPSDGDSRDRQVYATLVVSRTDLERFDWSVVEKHEETPGSTRSFLRNTDFDAQVVLCLQCPKPGLNDQLAVDSATVADGTLVTAVTFSDQPGFDAEALETLLLRYTLGEAEEPEAGEVSLTGHPWFDDPHVVETE